jgi:hypothetical protein
MLLLLHFEIYEQVSDFNEGFESGETSSVKPIWVSDG